MIDLIMRNGNEVILVRINGHNVMFGANVGKNPMMTTIDYLQLSYSGVIKEFPELKDAPNWRQEAIAKFKDKLRSLDSEKEIFHYVKTDLQKFGYVPMYKQIRGHRIEVLNAG